MIPFYIRKWFVFLVFLANPVAGIILFLLRKAIMRIDRLEEDNFYYRY